MIFGLYKGVKVLRKNKRVYFKIKLYFGVYTWYSDSSVKQKGAKQDERI